LDLLKSRNILKNCTEYGIYELSEEDYLEKYYQEWLEANTLQPYRRELKGKFPDITCAGIRWKRNLWTSRWS
jgi:hypothetical protein